MQNTRRDFIKRVGEVGGFAGAFATMQSLGLLGTVASAASVPELAVNSGKGVKVAILGGGIAGLVSAYELGKAGFECVVFEARERPGGRNWTIRNGSAVEFTDGFKQAAAWAPDSYFNAGPARIPSIHHTMLRYCRELGVELEVEVNSSRSALLFNSGAFDAKPVEQRQAINDTRGHVSELLAKCVQQNALDQEFNAEDKERVLAFLRTYGDLKPDFKYRGSSRSGLSKLPGAGPDSEMAREPLSFRSLLDANFWSGMLFEESLDMQATMFQPVGGMDRIPYAFAKRLGRSVQYKSCVKEIRRTETGVRIVYSQGSAEKMFNADYCICALPVTQLKSIASDFSPGVQQAIQDTGYADASKVAWESPRFWEKDFNLYGGISFLASGPINLVWYPSGKLFSETGVLVSGYGAERGSRFGQLPDIPSKLEASRAAVENLHPGFGNLLRNPMYVYWAKIPYSLGSWVNRGQGYYDTCYNVLTEPDGRFFFAGDHCARVGAWQEGAALAAHRAIGLMTERIRAERQGTTDKKRSTV